MYHSNIRIMENILENTLIELQESFKQHQWPGFRAKQVYAWLHKKLTFSFDAMTDLPKDLRNNLKNIYCIGLLNSKYVTTSKDGTKKFLFELEDGNLIESVLLKDITGRKTVCLSTQAGCPLKCDFCATGNIDFKRNLTLSEIIGQAYRIAEKNADLSNLVFMGMGEPFLNYDNVIKSIHILISKEGANFGQRKITISTCGIPDGIRKFAEEEFQVRLAISLNSASNQVRSKLMPINRKYPLAAVRDALVFYQKKTGRRVTLEYVMLDGVNDRQEDLKDLRRFCEGLDVNVNLIPFNPFGRKFRPSKLAAVHHFENGLAAADINTIVRRSKGTDILAACGQLAGKAE